MRAQTRKGDLGWTGTHAEAAGKAKARGPYPLYRLQLPRNPAFQRRRLGDLRRLLGVRAFIRTAPRPRGKYVPRVCARVLSWDDLRRRGMEARDGYWARKEKATPIPGGMLVLVRKCWSVFGYYASSSFTAFTRAIGVSPSPKLATVRPRAPSEWGYSPKSNLQRWSLPSAQVGEPSSRCVRRDGPIREATEEEISAEEDTDGGSRPQYNKVAAWHGMRQHRDPCDREPDSG